MERSKLNIYEIAKEAGVSAATVSRAINQPEKVNFETRKRVLEIVRKYDFKPNALARSLKNTRSSVIGLLTASVHSPFYGQLVAECVEAAKACGYVLLTTSYKCSREENTYSILEKRYAFLRMLHKYRLESREEWLRYGGYDQEDGYRIAAGMREEDMPTAVIGVNDQFACGVMKATFDAGLAVPRDLSVVSFDDTYIAACARPALSSVACDYGELAQKLVETAVKAVRGENEGRLQLVKTHLMERESVRKFTRIPGGGTP